MHYIYLINAEGIKEYFPIMKEAAEVIPDYAKDLAALAEKYNSHIEIDARTGNVDIIEGKELGEEPAELHPTWQVCRAVEHAFINQKYDIPIPENIREIDIKAVCPEFDGHLYCFIYVTAEEFQQSIIVLDKEGHYLSSYDELDQKFDPAVEGLDERAVNACAKAFEAGVELYKNELKKAAGKQVITR